ncbi:hypothetical protein DC20_21565 (plasmid) [Rufibacter tibetensis]|uniref:Uncharacterized protein n=1 Tax=Rufibacter tibetensis TaxID=512763 RepID=A0A0P0D1K1_9BACT|nr:hypothetical protein DC20_21565 [Rufibacter tibetensis]
MQFTGDSIQRFTSGNFLVIKANRFHRWKFDEAYFEVTPADVRSVHFCENSWERFSLHARTQPFAGYLPEGTGWDTLRSLKAI